MWDLTTALDISKNDTALQVNGGPSPEELLRLLDQCDLSNSHCSTPCMSPCPSLALSNAMSSVTTRIKACNVAFLNQQQQPVQPASASTAQNPQPDVSANPTPAASSSQDAI